MSSSINKPERSTQDRVIKLFTDTLKYRYLGDWSDRASNHCIEEGLLTEHLERSAHQHCWPRSPPSAWSTSWCMNWCTCWSPHTTSGSST